MMKGVRVSLQRENVISLYRQIATTLRDEMASGRFEPSGRLPGETDMGARFQVSRVTVRLALDVLEAEGLIERRKGKGTFTVGKRVRHPLDSLRSFHDSLSLQGLDAQMRLLSVEQGNSPEPLAPLFGPRCCILRRLHLVDGEAIALGTSHLPLALVDYPWAEAGDKPVYSILKEVTGQDVTGADVELKAETCPDSLASVLGARSGSALLVMERKSFLSGGDCADFTRFHIRSERYSFVLSPRWS